MGEIQRLLKQYEPLAICLQHTNETIPKIGNYNLAAHSIPDVNTLGTAIYVNNRITYDNILIHNSEFQLSGIKLHLNTSTFYLYNIYNQPSCHYDLQNLPQIIPNITDDFILVGDFNAHSPIWDSFCTEADSPGNKIEHMIDHHNFCLLNDGDISTYFSNSHGCFSSIDLSICSSNIVDKFEWNVLDDPYTSDHFPILISLLAHTPTPRIPRYKLEKADWDQYKCETSQIPPLSSLEDHDDIATFFTNFVITAANKSIPKSSNVPKKHSVPWWSDTLSDLIHEKHAIGRRLNTLQKRFSALNKTPLLHENNVRKLVNIVIEITVLKPHYNRISAKFRKEAIKGRIMSWNKYVSTISDTTSISKVWEKFRKINGSHVRSQRHALLHNGQLVHDSATISNILGRNIAAISSITNIDDHFKAIKSREEAIPLNFETLEDIYYNQKFTEEEFEHALSNCSSSAPGKDNISFDMIKNLAPLAKTYLLQFYNHLWVNQIFPKVWKHAVVIPISKPGKDPSNPNNYRPISLTSCLCKLMEKMVNNRLNWVLRKNKVLSPTQCGSQAERSTLDSLSHLENHIRRGFERKQITVAIFFDIQKAYDTTWRYLILKSLHHNGFRGHLPIFIKNFLNERTFQTRIENVYSDTFNLDSGVPQGSVLSGTLFALAINDIAKQLPQGVQNSLYVDDFAIYYSSSSLRHIQRIMNKAIKNIQNWTSLVGFKLSVEKTQAIMFYRNSRWKQNQEIELKLGNNNIQFGDTVKFLGLMFDTHLNWKAHVAYVKNKCNSALNLMLKLSHTTWGARRQTLLMVYKALVLSKLDYGSPIYSSASRNTLKSLDPIHTRGLRLCTGAFKSSPNTSVCCESGEPPLPLHRDLVTMRSALKIMSTASPTKQLFDMPDIFINNHEPPFPIRANRLLDSTGIRVNLHPPLNSPPPWIMKKIKVCSKLYHLSKQQNYTPDHYKQCALEHIQSKGPHKAIYTDGSKSSVGVGCAAVSSSRISQNSLPTNATVFTAELTAIILAVEQIKFSDNNLNTKYVIYSDSKSAIEALKNYIQKNPLVKQIRQSINKLYSRGIQIEVCWIPAHVGIPGNEKADEKAKSGITCPIYDVKLPVGDYIGSLKNNIKSKWQDMWNNEPVNNKLKNIKTTIGPWNSSIQQDRRTEVILTRLRIGHTRYTHGYLMSMPHDNVPHCRICNVQLTVKHILCECRDFNQQRHIYLKNKSLLDILSDSFQFSLNRILMFLRQTNLINKI